MASRYERLFSLKENLYQQGSPILIKAGALLKDTQTGNIIAQLKFENIQNKPVKGITVSILPLDVTGKALGEEFEHTYLDFILNRTMQTGDKQPILVKEGTCRAFSARVKSVVFTDNSDWTASGEPWEALPGYPLLSGDPELIKQYQMEVCPSAKYKYSEYKDLWACSCGALCREGEEMCFSCGCSRSKQKDCDLEALKSNCQTRLEAEKEAAERQAEEERIAAEKAAKKLKTIIAITAPIVCAIIAFVIVLNTVIIPKQKYNKAMGLIASGDYDAAYAMLEEIVKKDAIASSKYYIATQAYQAGDYETARAYFYQAGNYKDAVERCQSIEAKPQKETDSDGDVYTYAYDAQGNVIKATYTGSIGYISVEYEYDAQGNVIKATYSDGDVYTYEYEYDAQGNVIKKTDSDGDVTTYTYDAQGNVIKETYTGSSGYVSTSRYEYDVQGNVIKRTYSDGDVYTYEYEYDAQGNVIKKTDSDGDVTTTTTYSEFVYFPKKE